MKSTAPWPAAVANLARLAAVVALATGCGSNLGPIPHDGGIDRSPEEPLPVDASTDAQVTEVEAGIDGGTCAVVVEQHPDEGALHIPCTSPAVYDTDPPSSGNHYPQWAAYQTYESPVPWGNLVHCLEHGAVVVVYNCPEGCPDEVARAGAWIDALPPDPSCPSHRIVLAPDPTLGVRWAASAWTWTLRSDCFDESTFSQFYADHYGHGLELVCSDGASDPAVLCAAP